MTDDEMQQQVRRGYWLKLARERAEFTLAAAAEAAGLSAGSGSTVSHWEAGDRPIKVIHLSRLAQAYAVPLDWFIHPERTDEERLTEAIRSASDAERADWEAGADQAPTTDGGPSGAPHRRTA